MGGVGNMKYLIEAREKQGGGLKFDCEQPQVRYYTENEIADLYFRLSQDKSYSVSKETIANYFAGKNWYIREKTWGSR